jgi:hypothetical protein
MCSPHRLVEGSGRKGLAVVAQCAPSASFVHSRLPASRAGAVDPAPPLANGRSAASDPGHPWIASIPREYRDRKAHRMWRHAAVVD